MTLKLNSKRFGTFLKKIAVSFSTAFLLIFALFGLASCKTTQALVKEKITNPEILPVSELVPAEIIWQNVQDGVEMTGFEIKHLGVSWHCVKIDLDTPGINLFYQPTPETLGQIFSVKKVAAQEQAMVAINSTPFDLDGKTYLPVGITKYENQTISEINERYCALCFNQNEKGNLRAFIEDSQTEESLSQYPYAFGGFFTILRNGKTNSFAKNKRSRVGAGISSKGRFLFLMVATPNFSLNDRNGLNYEECAEIFKALGCSDAMQFDGGHSSALVVNGKDIEKPFLQRKVPTILGFKHQ